MTATASATASHLVDVAIVGGGMVGASLAVALRDTPLTVALIEGFAPDAAAQPSFDDRTTAIGNGSRGPITAEIQDAFFGLFNGSTHDAWGWLEHVGGGEIEDRCRRPALA